ncbi:MAG: Glyoxalase/bleomycin resistance protein/dioxygenase [Chitinophagaceae bacterium]|nr:Glyoxalase/bleomycin resistance protein/dioxygenase [Chitinophagaceae bacterium]
MPVNPKTPGIHHIAFRCMDMETTKGFYKNIIGFPLAVETPDLIIFAAGFVHIAFKPAKPRDGKYTSFSPFEVGLDHIAMTCQSEEELRRFTKEITEAGVENTGVKLDETLQKLYVAFKDPDRIQWEFYMA